MSRYIDAENKEAREEYNKTGYLGTLEEVLTYFPTADVAPVVYGHWECFPGTFAPNGVKGCVICSACNTTVDLETFRLMDKCGLTRKCGACGAQMDKG